MKATEFAHRCKEVAEKYKTVYMLGTFGAPVTEKLLERGKRSRPSWYTDDKLKTLSQYVDKGYFAFDCSGLLKAILWGWNGDADASYGGAGYKANGVPDFSSGGVKALSHDVSEDFSSIEVGEVLYQQGHVGLYVGDGMSVECTSPGVILRKCVSADGKPLRGWLWHAKLNFVEYESETEAKPLPDSTDLTLTIRLSGVKAEAIAALKEAFSGDVQVTISEAET